MLGVGAAVVSDMSANSARPMERMAAMEKLRSLGLVKRWELEKTESKVRIFEVLARKRKNENGVWCFR